MSVTVNGSGSHDMVEHECVADHCVACCPVARSYSEGFEAGKTIYSSPVPGPLSGVDPLWVICLVLIIATMHMIRTSRREAQTC